MSGLSLLADGRELAVATLLLVATGGALLVLELRRSDSRRRGWRLLAAALVLLALALLLARPAAHRRAAGTDATLLTPGASLAQLAAASSLGTPVWSTPARPGEPPPPRGATALADAAALARHHPELRTLRVAGHGLTAAEWAALPFAAERAAPPPPLPTGIAAVRWERRLPLGRELVVSGRVAVPSGASARVTLEGSGVGAVTAEVTADSPSFALHALPRGSGRHLLTLRLALADREVAAERLEVQVAEEVPPAVLWLEGAPSLESRELARWLPAQGMALAVRSRLAPTALRESVHGMPRRSLSPLTTDRLAPFDLVVVDGDALAALAAPERAALETAVRESGLGVLLRVEEGQAQPSPLGERFTAAALAGEVELQARLAWPDGATALALALAPRELRPTSRDVPLAADAAGRLLAAWRPLGRGAVGVTLVDGTWRWSRAGERQAHRRYWAEVLAALARPLPPTARWTAAEPALVGRPLALTLEGEEAVTAWAVTAPDGSAARPGLREDPTSPGRFATTWWPRVEGWHRVGEGDAALWAWVAGAERWPTLRLAERQAATAARLEGAPAGDGARDQPPARLRPLPRWPVFVLLLLALAALWGEELLAPGGKRLASSDA